MNEPAAPSAELDAAAVGSAYRHAAAPTRPSLRTGLDRSSRRPGPADPSSRPTARPPTGGPGSGYRISWSCGLAIDEALRPRIPTTLLRSGQRRNVLSGDDCPDAAYTGPHPPDATYRIRGRRSTVPISASDHVGHRQLRQHRGRHLEIGPTEPSDRLSAEPQPGNWMVCPTYVLGRRPPVLLRLGHRGAAELAIECVDPVPDRPAARPPPLRAGVARQLRRWRIRGSQHRFWLDWRKGTFQG